MKYVSLEEIHQMFFRETLAGTVSTSLWWTRDKVYELVSLGLLSKARTFLGPKVIYLANQRTLSVLKKYSEGKQFPYPQLAPSLGTFVHDRLLVELRSRLQKNNKDIFWISENSISLFEEYKFLNSRRLRPDGIYFSKNEKRIALELEIARKSDADYKEKIQHYVHLIRARAMSSSGEQVRSAPFGKATSSNEQIHSVLFDKAASSGLKVASPRFGEATSPSPETTSRLFDSVHYVVDYPNILKKLRTLTEIYKNIFLVESLEEFQERYPLQQLTKETSAKPKSKPSDQKSEHASDGGSSPDGGGLSTNGRGPIDPNVHVRNEVSDGETDQGKVL